MKRLLILTTLTLLLTGLLAGAAQARHKIHWSCDGHDDLFRDDDVDVDFERGNLIIECRDDDDEVLISDDFDLFINNDKVKLDRGQRKLVKRYYIQHRELRTQAREIGRAGAKIGIRGVKVAGKSIALAIAELLEDGDWDELEDMIDEMTEEIEEDAEDLEDLAEDLEDLVDDLEDTHYDLRDSVDELDELDWF